MKRINKILVGAVVLCSMLLGSTALAAPAKVRSAMDVLKNMLEASQAVKTSEGNSVLKFTIKTPVYKVVQPKKKLKKEPAYVAPATGESDFGIGLTTSGLDDTLLGERKVVGSKTTNVNLYINSKLDDENKAAEVGFHLDFKTDKEKPSVLEGEVRVIGEDIYFKYNKLEINSAAFSSEKSVARLAKLNTVTGQWMKISEQYAAGGLAKSSSYSADLLDLKKEMTAEEQEMLNYFVDLIVRNKVLVITALRGQTIAGHQTYHYSISFNKRGLANAIVEAEEKYSGYNSYSEPLDAKAAKKALVKKQAEMYKDLAKITLPTLEVWIGRDDFYLYKYNVRYNVNLQALLKAPYAFAMSLAHTVKSVNQPVSVVAPEGARDYEEVDEQLFGEEKKVSRDKMRLGDLKRVQTALEFYYTDMGHYPTTTPDGINLGEENAKCLNGTGFHATCPYSSSYDENGNYISNYTYTNYILKDPKNGKYWYISQDGTTYSIKTDLEAGTADLPKGQIVAQPSGITSTNPAI